MIRVVALDIFGTVVNMSRVNREELKAYAAHLRECRESGIWRPLVLPAAWMMLPAHPDSVEGINLLRQRFKVVTCSNAPIGLLDRLLKNNHIDVDAIIPIEANRVFKPNPLAYQTICQVMRCEPAEVLMVTANSRPSEDFNDIAGARAVGMQSVLVRDEKIPSLMHLAKFSKEYIHSSEKGGG